MVLDFGEFYRGIDSSEVEQSGSYRPTMQPAG